MPSEKEFRAFAYQVVRDGAVWGCWLDHGDLPQKPEVPLGELPKELRDLLGIWPMVPVRVMVNPSNQLLRDSAGLLRATAFMEELPASPGQEDLPAKERTFIAGPKFQDNPLAVKDVQVTDGALGFEDGSKYSFALKGENPGAKLVRLSPPVAQTAGPLAGIDCNPYNFVSLSPRGPWVEDPPKDLGSHPGHDEWRPNLHHGSLRFTLIARTPIHLPSASESARMAAQKKPDSEPRPFFRMCDGLGVDRYAIPGSSFKGALRAIVEAIANDRFGASNTKRYKWELPYRRRAFQFGQICQDRIGKLFIEQWKATEDDQNGVQTVLRRNLLYQEVGRGNAARYQRPANPKRFDLSNEVLEKYNKYLEHPHFETHFNAFNPNQTPAPDPPSPYRKEGFPASIEDARQQLRAGVGDFVYFIASNDKKVTSLGRNVNYLWPARHSIFELAQSYFPPAELALRSQLGIAERLFGWAKPHKTTEDAQRTTKVTSSPFRGKIRCSTLWGPKQSETAVLRLAPLTSPPTHAKSRPLYLKPSPNGVSSGSYADEKPALRGRKFYWKQRWEGERGQTVWPKHLYSPIWHPANQCPPAMETLPAGVRFEGELHFENLSNVELGALLAALRGVEPSTASSYTIHLGKGRPRGLGAFQVETLTLQSWQPSERYATLESSSHDQDDSVSIDDRIREFVQWCRQAAARDGSAAAQPAVETPNALREFDLLSRWPEKNRVCYYPLNFSQYSWLPAPERDPDEPRIAKQHAERPVAMRSAIEIGESIFETNSKGEDA